VIATSFDREWLGRAVRASGAIYLGVLLVALGTRSVEPSLGITLGYALAVGLIASWSFIVRAVFTPEAARDAGAAKRRTLAIALAIVKLPLLGAVVYAVVARGMVSASGFAGGFAIPQLTLVLFAIGSLATQGARKSERTVEGGLRP
jgi:hypothetical protein